MIVFTLITYIASFFLFKLINRQDVKHDLWNDRDWDWTQSIEGRRKIYFILLLIPFLNLLMAVIIFIVLMFYKYGDKINETIGGFLK